MAGACHVPCRRRMRASAGSLRRHDEQSRARAAFWERHAEAKGYIRGVGYLGVPQADARASGSLWAGGVTALTLGSAARPWHPEGRPAAWIPRSANLVRARRAPRPARAGGSEDHLACMLVSA